MEPWMIERHSCRQYLNQQVSQEIIDEIDLLKKSFQFPHHQQFDWEVTTILDGSSVATQFKGPISRYVTVKAPHYLLLSCSDQDNDSFLIGFLGECFVRRLTELKIATCWVGFPMNKEKAHNLGVPQHHNYKIMIAFGYPDKDVHKAQSNNNNNNNHNHNHNHNNRKRKSLKQIGYSGHAEDLWLYQALSIAPSAVNTQPWHLEHTTGRYEYFMTKKSLLSLVLSGMNAIDMGIGFYHIYSAIKDKGYRMSWDFERIDKDLGRLVLHFKYFE